MMLFKMFRLVPLLILALTKTTSARQPASPVRKVENDFVAGNIIANRVTSVRFSV